MDLDVGTTPASRLMCSRFKREGCPVLDLLLLRALSAVIPNRRDHPHQQYLRKRDHSTSQRKAAFVRLCGRSLTPATPQREGT